MRITLYDPHEKITTRAVEDMLLLAGVWVAPEVIGQWTDYEKLLAFDWAAREHLSAGDNPVQRRPRPWFVTAALGALPAVTAWDDWLRALKGSQRPVGQDLSATIGAAQKAIDELRALVAHGKAAEKP